MNALQCVKTATIRTHTEIKNIYARMNVKKWKARQ